MMFSSNRIYLSCFSLAIIILAIDSSIPLGVAGGVPYIIVVLVASRHPYHRFLITMAIITSCLTILGYFLSPPGGEVWKVYFNRALALFAIWTATLLSLQIKKETRNKENALSEREKALDEIKILKGLLPICASCKKIRDHQGEWQQMETYIHHHSEATFSHGVCPECYQTLYPQLAKKKRE